MRTCHGTHIEPNHSSMPRAPSPNPKMLHHVPHEWQESYSASECTPPCIVNTTSRCIIRVALTRWATGFPSKKGLRSSAAPYLNHLQNGPDGQPQQAPAMTVAALAPSATSRAAQASRVFSLHSPFVNRELGKSAIWQHSSFSLAHVSTSLVEHKRRNRRNLCCRLRSE